MTLAALLCAATLARAAVGSEASIGWGIGIEMPRLGLMTGVGPRADLGWGYTLGGGLSWSPDAALQVHMRTVGGQSYGGTARLRYVDGAREVSADVPADWLSIEVQSGVTYQWLRADRGWVPFAGVEAGWGYGGFDYHLPADISVALEPPSEAQSSQQLCTVLRCTTSSNTAVGGFGLASARLGVRLLLTSWLSGDLELVASVAQIHRALVAATVAARAAHSVKQTVVFLRPTFTLHVGL